MLSGFIIGCSMGSGMLYLFSFIRKPIKWEWLLLQYVFLGLYLVERSICG